MIGLRASKLSSGDVIEIAGYPVRLRVDGRARRISLRVDAARRELVATAPRARQLAEAVAFAKSRSAWIHDRLIALPEATTLAPGEMLEVLGRPCRLEAAPTRRGLGLVEDGRLVLRAHGDGEAFGRSCVRVLRGRADTVLRERTYAHAAVLGVAAPEVRITDTRSRWGSCQPPRAGRAGVVRYSWRLVLAPYEVMDYVAAHEAAHLVRADHGPAFWAEVAKLTPHVKESRAWLRAHGPRLHAVGR